jgi:signal transduction histidine kinase
VVATAFVRLRPVIVAPFVGLVLVCLACSGAPSAQIGGFGAAAFLFVSFFSYERWRARRQLVDGVALARSLAATAIGLGVACALTGAMGSPLVPMLFAPVGVAFAAFGRTRPSAVVFGLLGAIVVTLVLFTPAFASLSIAEPYRRLVLGAAVVDAAVLLWAGVATLAAAHTRAAATLAEVGDEIVLAAHARTRTMETQAARIAHELKNPLSAIRALVEVMLESADERGQRRLTVAAGEIARIERIVDGYRSLSDRHPLDVVELAPTDVRELVGRVVAILEARAEKHGVSLVAEGLPDPAVFPLARDRVKEALLNLVLNALEASPPGARVVVSGEVSEAGLEVRVADSGVGMDAEALAKIGTPFFTRREGGTGLGVALARQVAAQHGGELRYESALGRGTTAILQLRRP